MLTIMIAAVAAQLSMSAPWAEFSRSGALNHVDETVEISTQGGRSERGPIYELRYTTERLDSAPETRSTDSGACPAARTVVESMRDIDTPSPAPYGINGKTAGIVLDGASYRLRVPSSYKTGDLTMTSNADTPLAEWIDASFESFASCWKAEPR
ncbi:hypothetical protein [Pacificimonas flava]|nr:hypothetical protein [Pacificimonas flava]MBB5280319.1 hypothetical protein [Pacificimonas flava]